MRRQHHRGLQYLGVWSCSVHPPEPAESVKGRLEDRDVRDHDAGRARLPLCPVGKHRVVAAVAGHHDEPLEAMPLQRFDVRIDDRHQQLGAYRQAAREGHVVLGAARSDDGRDERIAEPEGETAGVLLAQQRVGGLGQMWTVLFGRPGADDHAPLATRDRSLDIRPGHPLYEHLGHSRGNSNPITRSGESVCRRNGRPRHGPRASSRGAARPRRRCPARSGSGCGIGSRWAGR